MHKIAKTKEDWLVDMFVYIILILTFVLTIYPFLNVLAISLNDAIDSMRGEIYIWPREFTLFTYKEIFKDKSIYSALFVSLFRTIFHTGLSVFLIIVTAYLVSRKEFVLRKPMNIMLIITMYVHGGLVPGYLLMKSLNLPGTLWVYIVPGLITVFNVIIARTYIEGLPYSLVESAKIDGATEMQILFKIIMPLIIPVMAVIIIFVAIHDWNAWFDTYLYGNGKKYMMTLQYKLMEKLSSVSMSVGETNSNQAANNAAALGSETVTPASMRAAMTMVVTIPIIMVYPFFQKYFVSGMTLGGVKE